MKSENGTKKQEPGNTLKENLFSKNKNETELQYILWRSFFGILPKGELYLNKSLL